MKNKEYALALSGGGTRGAYEIGAYRALKEIGINIVAIAGTSIGALNGAMFVSDNLDKAEEMYNNIKIDNVIDIDEDTGINPDKDIFNFQNIFKLAKDFNKKKEFVFPLSVEYGNKVVDTFDHKKTTMKEYIKQNNVLDSISLSSIVYMKDGRILKGEDFLKELYKYIYKYENFLSLRNDLINLIEYK